MQRHAIVLEVFTHCAVVGACENGPVASAGLTSPTSGAALQGCAVWGYRPSLGSTVQLGVGTSCRAFRPVSYLGGRAGVVQAAVWPIVRPGFIVLQGCLRGDL